VEDVGQGIQDGRINRKGIGRIGGRIGGQDKRDVGIEGDRKNGTRNGKGVI
jgi:hypothetical protein